MTATPRTDDLVRTISHIGVRGNIRTGEITHEVRHIVGAMESELSDARTMIGTQGRKINSQVDEIKRLQDEVRRLNFAVAKGRKAK